MTPEQFVYWLHGYFELSHDKSLDQKQVEEVKNHLSKVFNKEPKYEFKEPNKYMVNEFVDYAYPFVSC